MEGCNFSWLASEDHKKRTFEWEFRWGSESYGYLGKLPGRCPVLQQDLDCQIPEISGCPREWNGINQVENIEMQNRKGPCRTWKARVWRTLALSFWGLGNHRVFWAKECSIYYTLFVCLYDKWAVAHLKICPNMKGLFLVKQLGWSLFPLWSPWHGALSGIL